VIAYYQGDLWGLAGVLDYPDVHVYRKSLSLGGPGSRVWARLRSQHSSSMSPDMKEAALSGKHLPVTTYSILPASSPPLLLHMPRS
jgi:hypothetical protein